MEKLVSGDAQEHTVCELIDHDESRFELEERLWEELDCNGLTKTMVADATARDELLNKVRDNLYYDKDCCGFDALEQRLETADAISKIEQAIAGEYFLRCATEQHY